MECRKIAKAGNGYCIPIPKRIMNSMGWKKRDWVIIEKVEEGILIKKTINTGRLEDVKTLAHAIN